MSEDLQQEHEFSIKGLFVPFTTLKAIHWIVIIGIIVFFNGLFNNFVGDDEPQITDNVTIHSIQNLPLFFTGGTFYSGIGNKLSGFSYKPLVNTTYSVIYTFFGSNYFWFHFFQIFLYIINVCLLFLVFKHFLKNSTAFFLSLVFLVHPINSETALYISATQEVLFFFFGTLALVILIKYQSKKMLLSACLLLFISLLSKETGILFLCISLLYIFLFQRKYFYTFLGYSSMSLCLYGLLRLIAVGISNNAIYYAPIQKLNLLSRIINMPAIFWFYLKTFTVPLELSSSYQWVYRQIDLTHFLVPILINLLFLASISGLAYILYKNYPRKYFTIYIFFAVWFVLGILLDLQIIPLDFTVAERWFYFPIVGLLGMIGVFLEVVHINFRNKVLLVVLSIVVLLLSIRTFDRTFDFRNNFTLSMHDLKVSNSFTLENELSVAYFRDENYKEAKLHAQKSISLNPYYTNYISLGAADFYLGEYKEAKGAYMKSLQLGDYYQTYENLGALSYLYGDKQTNIDFLKNVALRKYPQDAKLWLYVAVLEYNYGNKDNARYDIAQAHSLDQGQDVSNAYNAIMNNQPVGATIKK